MTTERDSRGYWSLPERREEQSYYVYGTPSDGAAQFAHPSMLGFIFKLEFVWGQRSDAELGIGNISLREGVKDRHRTHRVSAFARSLAGAEHDRLIPTQASAGSVSAGPDSRQTGLGFRC